MSGSTGDVIVIEDLKLQARVGVPDQERAEPQQVAVNLTLWPTKDFASLNDELSNTVDYAAVAHAAKEFVSERSDKLIETLAHGLAEHLLQTYQVRRVRVEVRKFVLPETRHVAAICERPA